MASKPFFNEFFMNFLVRSLQKQIYIKKHELKKYVNNLNSIYLRFI